MKNRNETEAQLLFINETEKQHEKDGLYLKFMGLIFI